MNETLASLRGSTVAIIRCASASEALRTSEAALAQGFATIEVTWTTPDAAAVVRSLVDAGHTVGAGTVLLPHDADAAIEAGASFLVAPSNPPFLLGWCATAGILAVPGAATPNELHAALDGGAELVKLFPAARLGGPEYVRDLVAPFPQARLMCTGGVTPDSAADYLAAGAYCLGMSVR